MLPAIVLDRLTRTLIGPSGARAELPVLTLRLLDALAESSPAFVNAETLQQRVWPDTHITADALKQRVRLLRRSLAAAGYDVRLLDSARGEGYALRARIRESAAAIAEAAGLVPVATPTPKRMRRRWLVAGGLAAVLVVIGFGEYRRRGDPPVIGPSPVRIGLPAPSGDPLTAWLTDALAGTAHVLLVSGPTGSSGARTDICGDATRLHLCVRTAPVPGRPGVQSLTLVQLVTGGILLRAEVDTHDGADGILPFALQLSQFTSPGVLRWLGGRTGAGDRTFTQYREGVRLLGACDHAALDDVMHGLREAAVRSPNFLPGRALLALHEVDAAAGRGDTAAIARAMHDAESVVAEEPNLALGHLAIARGAAVRGDDPLARSASARAIRLQPVLGRIIDERGGPRAGGGAATNRTCAPRT